MNGGVALVTGAGSGIGRAVAVGLAGAGYSVVLVGRRADKLGETAKLAGDARMLAAPADVGDPQAVRQVFEAAVETFGRLDLLFNNAGVGAPPRDIDELSVDDWLNVVQVNLNGAFFCAREAFRVMKAQRPRGGRIINNGSISAHVPRPQSAAYTATKHAITGLTRSLSLDGRPHDIACGQIDIGNAETPLASAIGKGVPQADGSVKAEPMMAVDDVTAAVLMMAGLPLSANVQFMTVMATKMPFIGRG
ncbi:MAG TPA: SDR family oxidoreductase [Caulobacteraceae bacterium]|jgi:NAD(P)-dependent dehydrogenase (short-subunit alcohol dehydrogenase family)|nr:SDR family oxidoreductase [Caulobacteraceae bacterium]